MPVPPLEQKAPPLPLVNYAQTALNPEDSYQQTSSFSGIKQHYKVVQDINTQAT